MSDAKRHEQKLSWGDVMWAWVKKGYPREEAAHRADLFMAKTIKEMQAENEALREALKRTATIGSDGNDKTDGD